MFDIHFYMKVHELKHKLMSNTLDGQQDVFNEIDKCRSKDPVIYNIETTNACNMRCEMCPRTTMMTRRIEELDMDIYKKIISQIRPFSSNEWSEWESFVEQHYKISKNDMSENHFFLHIIPRVLVLHGYGDPLLDRKMTERVQLLTEKGISSYFSCNPANINLSKTQEMFASGLDYVKFSIESVDDLRHKEVRGNASNYTDSYRKILDLLEMKEKKSFTTTIVITMLNLNKPWQQEEFQKLIDAFKSLDVYLYIKSQDQQWYQYKKVETKSVHWLEFCQFPWSSMTIKSNGEAAMCVEDFNNEIILGDSKRESLTAIWNGEKYRQLRQDHFSLTTKNKCSQQCDMTLVGSLVR